MFGDDGHYDEAEQAFLWDLGIKVNINAETG